MTYKSFFRNCFLVSILSAGLIAAGSAGHQLQAGEMPATTDPAPRCGYTAGQPVKALNIIVDFPKSRLPVDLLLTSAQKSDKKKHKDHDTVSLIRPGNTGQLIDAKKEAIIGNMRGARDQFRKYIEKYPADPVGYYELARIEANMNNPAEAIGLSREAVRLNPDNLWYSIFLAELYQLTGNTADAIPIYEEIVVRNPQNPDYLYQLSALYLQAERYTDAIRIYDQLEARTGVSEDVSIQKQKIYLHLNDLPNAEKEILNLIASFPADSRYYGILAEFYLANNMPEKALATYLKIAELDPSNPYVHMSLADYYRKTGNKEKAFEELKLGFANPNLDIDTKVTILLSFYSVNEIYNDLKDQAFALSTILINTHPKDPKAWSIYGDLLTQEKKYPEAREAFIKVLALDSSRYAVWEQVLRLDLQESKYDHLLSYGNRAIQLFPDQPVPYLFCGLAALQLKEYDSSLKLFKAGAMLVAENDELLAQFYMYQGDALHAMKKEDDAFKAYELSLKLKGDNAYVLNNYAYYLSLRGERLDKAEEMARKAVSLDPENPSFQDTYGWIFFRQGKFKEASEWILKALQNKEEPSAEVLEHYGDVLYKLGDTTGALDYWQKAKMKGEGSELLDRKISEKKYIQ